MMTWINFNNFNFKTEIQIDVPCMIVWENETRAVPVSVDMGAKRTN